MFKKAVINSRRFLTTTIDPNELNKFKVLSSEWWNIFGSMKPLHSMNSVRVPFITNGLLQQQENCKQDSIIIVQQPLNNLRILDVGCGGGILTEALVRLGASVTGIDPNLELIEIAKRHLEKQQNLNKNNISYCAITIDEYGNSVDNYNKFDAIIASEVIEHVNNPQIFLNNCLKCLKPNGSLFITTISKTVWSKVFAIFFAENLTQMLPKSTHDYEKFIQLHQLERILLDCNCRIICTHGMLYNPFNNTWKFSKNTCINYAVHALKLEV